jgi:hypothetical protein
MASTSKRLGRPKKIEGDAHRLVMVLDAETVEGLDAWVEELRATQFGASGMARTDLIREILGRAVREHQRDKRKKGTKR